MLKLHNLYKVYRTDEVETVALNSVNLEIEASWKSALPKKGTVVSSWVTNTSIESEDGPGATPMPSGSPWKVNPPRLSPLVMIAFTYDSAGRPASRLIYGGSLVKIPCAIAVTGKSAVATTRATLGPQFGLMCMELSPR